jgi:hypothetical protein
MTSTKSTLVLLTYKGKVLLTFQEADPTLSLTVFWSFLGGVAQKNMQMRDSALQLVEEKIGITLSSVTLVAVQMINNSLEHFYATQLSDDEVNHIVRSEKQMLSFFSLSELKNLTLSTNTRYFATRYADLVKEKSVN